MSDSIKRLLVANRGEIALRVLRSAREMGVATVAVYTEQDRHAPYVQLADDAYLLPGDSYRDTFLNEEAMIDVLLRSGADAVHPGYGFLSEVDSFARKVIGAGAHWVGPSPEALVALGDKISARRVATRAKVPPVPGISDPVSNINELLTFSQINGYPIILKRTDGGGGRGITIVHDDDELRGFFLNHDAQQGGDLDEYFVERYIDHARHVETQCGRDSHGNFTVYSTRDCTVQRRHQKLVEEAPAPFLTADCVERLERYSRRLFEAVDYVGLGTCEYMVTANNKVFFLEVNPRLQVEHTVSEQVCGLDLVREQITIASGNDLTPANIPRGHSFELRITSEDPATNLTPSSGSLTSVQWPSGPGIRVDSGVQAGDTISPKFDSLMGKLVVTAQDRPTAIARVRRALGELSIEGVPTPKPLFEQIFQDPEFTAEDHPFSVSTAWLERRYLNRQPTSSQAGQPASLGNEASGESKPESERFSIEVDNRRLNLTIPRDIVERLTGSARARAVERPVQTLRGQGSHHGGQTHAAAEAGDGVIASPLQAVVTRVNVAPGQEVAKGDLLVVLESMKMENYVYAPLDGVVSRILVRPSDGVQAGDTLVAIEATGAAAKGGAASQGATSDGAAPNGTATQAATQTTTQKGEERHD